jgi:hypothetical protein
MSADGSVPLTMVGGEIDRLSEIRFSREICGDLAAAERREWWTGNGLGA